MRGTPPQPKENISGGFRFRPSGAGNKGKNGVATFDGASRTTPPRKTGEEFGGGRK